MLTYAQRKDRAAIAFEHIKIADRARAKAKNQNGTQPLDLPFNRQTKQDLEETDVYKLFSQGWDKLWSQDKSLEHAVVRRPSSNRDSLLIHSQFPMPPLHHVHILAIASPEQLADEVIRALNEYKSPTNQKLLLWTWTDQAGKTKSEGYRIKFRWSIEAEPKSNPSNHRCHILMGGKDRTIADAPWSFPGQTKEYRKVDLRQFIIDALKFDKRKHLMIALASYLMCKQQPMMK